MIINGRSEKELMEITQETERKMAKLFKEYPCIYYTCTAGRNSTFKDMCFNEQYINEMGFSLESYASTVLREGPPR